MVWWSSTRSSGNRACSRFCGSWLTGRTRPRVSCCWAAPRRHWCAGLPSRWRVGSASLIWADCHSPRQVTTPKIAHGGAAAFRGHIWLRTMPVRSSDARPLPRQRNPIQGRIRGRHQHHGDHGTEGEPARAQQLNRLLDEGRRVARPRHLRNRRQLKERQLVVEDQSVVGQVFGAGPALVHEGGARPQP